MIQKKRSGPLLFLCSFPLTRGPTRHARKRYGGSSARGEKEGGKKEAGASPLGKGPICVSGEPFKKERKKKREVPGVSGRFWLGGNLDDPAKNDSLGIA